MSATANAPTILVVDDSPLCRDMVRKGLAAEGLSILDAADGYSGLAQLEKHPVDAVILDNEMPNMAGIPFLKALRSTTRWKTLPVLMLTTSVSKEVILEASKYHLSGYVLKARLSMPDMIMRINRILGKSIIPVRSARAATLDKLSVPNLVQHDSTLDAAAQFALARTLPEVVSQLKEITSDAKPSLADITAVVKQDPLLAARVVQLAAAAPCCAPKSRTALLDDAVIAVGIPALRDLLASFPTLSSLPNKPPTIELLRCWQHALAAAAIMARIAPKTDSIPAGLPYMLGLCHDLPEILLRQRFPDEFNAAVDFARQADVPPSELVRQVFGAHYSEVTEVLFDRMKFPLAYSKPIKEFQAAACSPADAHPSILARSLCIANFLAHAILAAPSPQCLVAPVSQNDCRLALISTKPLSLKEVASESLMLTRMLSGAAGPVEAALNKPLLPPTDAVVWYTRHPGFAALDPLEAALASLATVHTHDRLPQSDELANIHALIIASSNPPPKLSELPRIATRAGTRLPLLYLTPGAPIQEDTPSPDAEILQYPLTLARLKSFLAKPRP
ncbi:MAG TPA: HDOD domain-containing protein [Phycisphaerae bacterium]|nr:HDOD domain-containing protein [Phycisphaerae bacterium]